MKATYPLISCICVTNNRTALLKRAIACFEAQNYPNKELVVSYPDDDHQTKELIQQVSKNEELKILRIERSSEESLGNARNVAIDKCTGDYICIWDDDDWYHASRLSFQFNSMQTLGQGYQASILTNILLYDATTKKAYLSFPYTWDGTMLCRKSIIAQNQYAHSNKAEDTHIIKFLDSRKILYHIADAPFLYIYIYHGENTWDYSHFEYFLRKSNLLDDNVTKKVCSLVEL
ncbi:glycosyltransferase family A protein [Pedobacter sp. L105]|uniref:glycosyltransferase family 2 protein n=1 Tax=Pedobacter sp. L105 TaxID=1641871 RepID=UPI00131C62DF|nr:glycosyltransferase family A protein [Pedobacter sp. L105]